MKGINNIMDRGLCCLRPKYEGHYGNVTEIITGDGEKCIIYKTLKTILRIICRYYGLDLKTIRTKYGSIVNQKNIVPLPLSHDLVLLPFKMRKPIFIKDGSYGYVNIFYIEDIYEEGNSTKIRLSSGQKITCLNTLKTANDHLNKGKVIINDNAFKTRYNVSPRNYYFYEEFDSPATKGDIAILQKEIVEIKERLKKK